MRFFRKLTIVLLIPILFGITACSGEMSGSGKTKVPQQYSIAYSVLKSLKYTTAGEVVSEERTKTDKAVQVVVLIQGAETFDVLRERVQDLPAVECKTDDIEERRLDCRVGVEKTKLVIMDEDDVVSVQVVDSTKGKGLD